MNGMKWLIVTLLLAAIVGWVIWHATRPTPPAPKSGPTRGTGTDTPSGDDSSIYRP